MSIDITFTLTLAVDDVRTLVRSAREQAMAEGVDPADARETYSARDLSACVQMLLDPGTVPGCSVYGSSAEQD